MVAYVPSDIVLGGNDLNVELNMDSNEFSINVGIYIITAWKNPFHSLLCIYTQMIEGMKTNKTQPNVNVTKRI